MKRFDGDYNSRFLNEDSTAPLSTTKDCIEQPQESAHNNGSNRVKTTMLSRNINVLGHRTSIRLEQEMWDSLKSIADREGCKVHDICSLVHMRKRKDTSLTAAIRVFVMLYYKAAATEDGHCQAGHGNFDNMKRRAGFVGDLQQLHNSKSQQNDHDDDTNMSLAEAEQNANASAIVQSVERATQCGPIPICNPSTKDALNDAQMNPHHEQNANDLAYATSQHHS